MRRTNLCTKPTETLDALDGDPSNGWNFTNGSPMPLQPGQYVASCDVTERGSKGATVQYWDSADHPGIANHLRLGTVDDAVVGVNVMRIDPRLASDACAFSDCGCRATDFTVERADTYDLASGGGFRASSPQAPRRIEPIKAGGRR